MGQKRPVCRLIWDYIEAYAERIVTSDLSHFEGKQGIRVHESGKPDAFKRDRWASPKGCLWSNFRSNCNLKDILVD